MCVNVFGQMEQQSPPAIGVENISLARDDGHGNPGEIVSGFVSTDVPIHCLIDLSAPAAVTIKMNFVAVKAVGLKAETKIVTAGYTTTESQNRVRFNAAPDGIWPVGKYRIDIFLNGKPAKSLEFEIEKSAAESGAAGNSLPKSNRLRRVRNARLVHKN